MAVARIMIVDDDQTTVTLLQTLLEIDGYEVEVVMQGMQVIPRAQQTMPDLLLMDYHLSDIEGVEIVKDIRAHANLNHLPIIIASGMNVKDQVLNAGANEFIGKPFEPEDLEALFERLLNKQT